MTKININGRGANQLPQFIYKSAFRKHYQFMNIFFFHFLVVLDRKTHIYKTYLFRCKVLVSYVR